MKYSPKYKYSIFNNILTPLPGVSVLYNSRSKNIMRLADGGLPASPDLLSVSALDAFKKFGYVVDHSCDEAKDVFGEMIANLSSAKNFYMVINPTLCCNCRCWYCIENHPEGSRMSKDTLEKIKARILDILPRVETFTISFFGGEPFLEFESVVKPMMVWLREVCDHHAKPLYIIFTTNGLLVDEKKLSFLKEFPNQEYQITLDGGRESHNNTRVLKNGDSYAKVINTIKLLAENGLKVLVRLNLTHDNVETAFQIPESFRGLSDAAKGNLTMSCQQVWQDAKNGSLHDKFLEIKRRFIHIGIHPRTSDGDWIKEGCYADNLHCVTVNYNGDLFKCTAIDYNPADAIGYVAEADYWDKLNDCFNKFIERKQSLKDCHYCRILPLCGRGCYKKLMIGSEGCRYPSDEDKDHLILSILENLTLDRV